MVYLSQLMSARGIETKNITCSSWRFCCDDFVRSAVNRYIVANKLYIEAYLKVEAFLKGYSIKKEMPNWIPKSKYLVV